MGTNRGAQQPFNKHPVCLLTSTYLGLDFSSIAFLSTHMCVVLAEITQINNL